MTIPALPLAGSSVSMPLLGFGTWQLRGDSAYQAVRDALEAGYRHLDTATMYGNEAEVGRALRDSGVPRDEVFVTTKLPPERAGDERATIDASLRDLGLDAIDLWLIHWPPSRGRSVKTWREFVKARDEGLTRAIGVSNYGPDEIDQLSDETGERPAVNQIRFGPALYDAGLVAAHRERGVVLEGYSPFKTTNLHDPALTGIASAHGVDPARVVLRWHIQHEIVVIPKSATPERIARNADLDGFELTPDEMTTIDALGRR
ncbi:oxidoreductase [Paractinoplanes abujensis]|uniref:Diketogulonate reductase-like aldo/keto reductase n=1 Tax=Paractinoplanes abujensis TaxID=882441 RepID=A0A7W7CKL8_9ACTN|nr:aldo/keto reductase [Actinoplanes abujensis]MBB4690297.1 diketogulonate reductase-like aldo/keto reductase [Actinoplanes abujensis]GID21060.1 oxidoreductase [Actinoplanes abujensis]